MEAPGSAVLRLIVGQLDLFRADENTEQNDQDHAMCVVSAVSRVTRAQYLRHLR